MTKERLEAYRSMRAEIRELSERLDNLKDDEDLTVADTVLDYRSGQGIPTKIVGMDRERYWRRRQQYSERIASLKEECSKVEEWVEQIEGSMTRRIFRMVYLDGMNQIEVGKALHLDRSRISRRISDHLKAEDKAEI